jgi:hypothetical protein
MDLDSKFDANGGFRIQTDQSTGLTNLGKTLGPTSIEVDFIPVHPHLGIWTAEYTLETTRFIETHTLKCKFHRN